MQQIKAYIKTTPWHEWNIELASADASFRRYFRLHLHDETVVLMDSSLEKSSLIPFIDVTERLLKVGVKAPKILHTALEEGYLILEDFGNVHYLNVLCEENFKELYTYAMEEIIAMQRVDTAGLSLYDKAFLHFEMDLMQEWFLEKYLHVDLSDDDKTIIATTLDVISKEVLSQPQGFFVHRDYHSRNIMIPSHSSVGVIDYQDAMSGALTYDLVSLLKDCYISFDISAVEALVLQFRDMKGLDVDDATFVKWFDFMGLQRHIKVLGIFCRLYLRDAKAGYLNDLPLTLHYVLQTAQKYESTQKFATLLQQIELPKR
jgi:hypothetical protein